MIGFLKTHPFWTLLIILAVFALIQLLFTFGGSGSGGLDVGPITPERGP